MPFSKRRSLAVKIPLLMTTLLLLALAGMSAASYVELRASLIDIATGRLQRAADQLANVFTLSARQRIGALKQLMDRAEVRDFLRTQDEALKPQVEASIVAYLGQAIAFGNVELWDANGRRVFAAGADFEAVSGPLLEEYKKDLFATDLPAIGKLRQYEEGLRYPVGGKVLDGGRVLGYVLERRRITNPAQTRQTVALLTGLIGSEATMVIGNADGSSWSDLVTTTQLPIRGEESRLWEYQRAGMPRTLAWATPIEQTSWAVAIEFPLDVILEPSRRFLLRSAAIAATLLLVVGAVAWVTSRRITTPLLQVTEAAEAVAESKPHVRIDTTREDEIGRLAESFNTMAEKVEQSRTDLELRVELRTAELRAANRELEAFSYSVSHDLRAPLRAIVGFVQILEEDHSATLDSTARHHLDRVKLNARKMGQLIDDLLAFSQIGRTTMLRQTVDMQTMATAIAQEAIATAGRAIDLTVGPLPPAYGEAALLNQVFVNLISNAVKFTAKSEHPAIVVGVEQSEAETVYFVRDNGVGFDERYASKLFGVFQRLHRPDEFEGTGVGLAIVHRIISRHGGRVWAEGKLNAGATFYFTVPASAKPAEGKPPTNVEARSA
ncbi:MAG TPA: ATP-binding protein [Vicinamibacterales bacterium]|nr:ATP-binding protein [Vicinamibacterales bacterium]